MVQQGSSLSDRGVVLLSEAIIRRAAMDLWMASRQERKPGKYDAWRTERERVHAVRSLERWFHRPYAKMLLGCAGNCQVCDVNDVSYVVKAIKNKADRHLFEMDDDVKRVPYQRERRRLKR